MARSKLMLLTVAALSVCTLGYAGSGPRVPYESAGGFVPVNAIDVCVLAGLRKHGLAPAERCSDAVFLRRAYLDLIGTLPTGEEAEAFLRDRAEDKRARLVDDLLTREEYADYWALKWCDLLRVKAEFPINLWPNGVQAYYRWIHDAVARGMPYDAFARALLTSSGSNFREPPVNFYRAVQDRTPEGLAGAVALTFMGTRIERWPAERRKGLAAFFSRVLYKPTAEWKEEVVVFDPAPRGAVDGVLPDGTALRVPEGRDPRRAFAAWLLAEDNPWFARSIANRAWSWMMGRGVVHEPDDLRPDNPPSNAALLASLERALRAVHYDLRALLRTIATSRAYQASPLPATADPRATALFAHYPVRRLDAEVLIDALCRIDGRGEDYLSQVPEPFTILRGLQRSIRLADGTITSPFLEMFGRPARDTGLESERSNAPTAAQCLHLLNSTAVHRRIEGSPWLRRLVARHARDRTQLVRRIYLALLSRYPGEEELKVARALFEESGGRAHEPAADLVWALINGKEFLYRH